MFRVYLDNFDELHRVNKAEAISGEVSPLVFALREEYLQQGVPRHQEKTIQQQCVAEVDGVAGVATPRP